MSIEDMKRISEAEEEAVSIRRQAQADARQIQEEGRRQAAQVLEDARKLADSSYRQVLRQAEESAEKDYQARMAQVAQECDAMKAGARERLEKAVEIIAGKVVKSSGSC